jgi:hypothetical protein
MPLTAPKSWFRIRGVHMSTTEALRSWFETTPVEYICIPLVLKPESWLECMRFCWQKNLTENSVIFCYALWQTEKSCMRFCWQNGPDLYRFICMEKQKSVRQNFIFYDGQDVKFLSNFWKITEMHTTPFWHIVSTSIKAQLTCRQLHWP